MLVDQMRKHGYQSFDCRLEVQETYMKEIEQRLEKTAWKSGCRSWYCPEGTKATYLFPGTVMEFEWRTRRARLEDYVLKRRVEGVQMVKDKGEETKAAPVLRFRVSEGKEPKTIIKVMSPVIQEWVRPSHLVIGGTVEGQGVSSKLC